VQLPSYALLWSVVGIRQTGVAAIVGSLHLIPSKIFTATTHALDSKLPYRSDNQRARLACIVSAMYLLNLHTGLKMYAQLIPEKTTLANLK
jgi:hypothetical protein